jgi:hypothetical protein
MYGAIWNPSNEDAMAHSNPDLTCGDDAAAWRELMRLLAAKAYGRMTPCEIADLFPDLRELAASQRRGVARRERRMIFAFDEGA